MWVLAVLTFGLFSSNAFSCSQNFNFDEVENIAQVNCTLLNQERSCARAPQNKETLRQGLDRMFQFAETEKGKIIQHWDNIYKKYPVAQLFNDQRRNPSSNRPPDYIVEWFNEGQEGLNPEVTKEKIISSYLQYAEEFDCVPRIQSRYISRPLPVGQFRTQQESKNAIRDLAPFQDFINRGRGENALKDLTSCSARPMEIHGPKRTVALVHPPCSGNITKNFANNAWTISPTDAEAIASSNSELVQCIQERLRLGANIHHVTVSASSSALNNTGAARDRFCAKGFKELSQARAQSAVDNVLPKLFPNPEVYEGKKLEVKTAGSNGDGTSGECPYRLVNGREVLKPEYAVGGSKSGQLDDARFVKIVVTFDEVYKSEQNNPSFYRPDLSCKQIYFKCN